jgi:flagellar hook-associated protein 1
MSIGVAQRIALSSLLATQARMSVTSTNIANADTDGYTRKTVTQAATVTAGAGTGTAITGISASVDRLLLKSLIGATSELGAAASRSSYLDRLQKLFGSTSDVGIEAGTSLTSAITSLESAIAALISGGNSASDKAATVSALDTLAAQLRQTSKNVQALRADADQGIADAVGEVNDALSTIDDLNNQIISARALGQPTADLEDQRNSALKTISSHLDVTYFENGSGALQITTGAGQPLLDGAVHPLQYRAAGKVTAATTYRPDGSGGFSAITVDGKDITGAIKSGDMSALVTLRDETLPAKQAELDGLARQLVAKLNAVSNQGTASPPPSQLTGSTTVRAGDPLSATGTARFAVTDSSGKLVAYADLDLSSYATVGDLAAAIDGVSGLAATIDSSGHLVVSAEASGNGVAINQMNSAVGAGKQGLSEWLGLNNLLTGSSAADLAVRSDILAAPGRLPSSKLDSAATLRVGDVVVSPGSTTIATALRDALTGSTDFAAAGSLAATRTSFAGYSAQIIAGAATASATAKSALATKETAQATLANAMASQSGVNIDEEVAQMSELENLYSAAAQMMSTLNQMFETLLGMVRS